jgi:hypothetical protein
MPPDKPPDQQLQLAAKWVSDNTIPIHFSNAVAVSPIKNEFILTFGCAIPPIITPDMTPQDIANSDFPIKPLVRIGMTPDRFLS